MYLAYIDASGRPFDDGDTSETTYVLSCLIAHEQQWQYIDNKVKEIKVKHFPNLASEDIELHARDMLNMKGIFHTLSWTEIYSIFEDIFIFLSDDSTGICIISVVIMKQKMFNGKDIEKWAYRLLVERINKFMDKNNERNKIAGKSPEFGIMIIDSCGPKADLKLRIKITDMLKTGTYYSNLKYLIEDPLFTDSRWRNLSQLVDCIAYSVRKHFRNPVCPSFHDINWERYYQMVLKKYDCDENGKIEGSGLKVFP